MPGSRTARHHKKVTGHHQKRSKHFLKVYVPYLPLLVIIATGLSIGNFRPPTSAPRQDVLSYATEISANALLNATNQQRNGNGAESLTLNSKLNTAAQAKAVDMANRNYWSHNTPDGNPPWIFISNAGYSYSRAGENLAYGFATSSDTVTGWMNSTSHRDNLLNKDYTEVGFGFVNAENYNNSGEETIVVAMYATPLVSATPAPKTTAPKATTPSKQTTTTTPKTEPANERKVEVLVLDSQNKPAVGVKVTLHSEPREATTDQNGVATFTNVEPGNHTASAEIDGAKVEQKLTVNDDTKTVTVTMPKPELTPNTTAITSASITSVAVPKKVNRLELITKGALPWLSGLTFSIALIGGAYVLGKHSLALHKLVMRGERYVLQHTLLDATIISFVWLCYVVSRTAGTIL